MFSLTTLGKKKRGIEIIGENGVLEGKVKESFQKKIKLFFMIHTKEKIKFYLVQLIMIRMSLQRNVK